MRRLLLILVMIIGSLTGCLDDDWSGVGEIISRPKKPSGPDTVGINEPQVFSTSGAVSSKGHAIEYRFDFDACGNHDCSPWSDSTSVSKSWPDSGTYVVKAQARCARHRMRMSPWSRGKHVTVGMVHEIIPPEIRFATAITRIRNGTQVTITKPYDPAVLDTVGMFRPFSISYHGISLNAPISEYQFFPLSSGITIIGQNTWTTDLSDTVRFFPNIDNPSVPNGFSLPSGIFRLAAQCRDEIGAESVVDAGLFEKGVCQVAVNFDPDTEIFQALNTYYIGQVPHQRLINFQDDVPDTLPFRSWITVFYRGWDSPYDSILCQDDANKCIKYQKKYKRMSERFPYANSQSMWMPQDGEDTNPFGVTDSTSMNVGSVEYEIFIRSLDEYNKKDGTPAGIVDIVGNFDPVLDNARIIDHLGNVIGNGDTLTWNWWKPENPDTVVLNPPSFKKQFYFIIDAQGHDHPMEPWSGVKNWLYNFYDMQSIIQMFARAGNWVAGPSMNALSDTFRVTFTYPITDVYGDDVFNNLPPWINKTYDLVLKGRDTEMGEEFEQYMFVNSVKTLINVYPTSLLGRWTEEETIRFHLRIVR